MVIFLSAVTLSAQDTERAGNPIFEGWYADPECIIQKRTANENAAQLVKITRAVVFLESHEHQEIRREKAGMENVKMVRNTIVGKALEQESTFRKINQKNGYFNSGHCFTDKTKVGRAN